MEQIVDKLTLFYSLLSFLGGVAVGALVAFLRDVYTGRVYNQKNDDRN